VTRDTDVHADARRMEPLTWDAAVPRTVCRDVIRAMAASAAKYGGVLRAGSEVADSRLRICTEHVLGVAEQEAIVTAMTRTGVDALRSAGSHHAALDGPKFCSYKTGSYFRAHQDVSLDPLDPPQVTARQITLVCLLNDGHADDGVPAFEGGALVVHLPNANGSARPLNVPLGAGSIVAFGAGLLHEVRPVRSGTRFAAVAWLYDVPSPPSN
jgi:predicted 2-oxoglutarate/Fe(II)-dependent dioxygenase YbiX